MDAGRQGKRAVIFVVSTAVPTGRRAEDVFRWEQEYGWPVGHRGDNGDLQREEVHFFYHVLEPFHWGRRRSRSAWSTSSAGNGAAAACGCPRQMRSRPARRRRPGVRPVDLRAVRHCPGRTAELGRALRGVERLRLHGLPEPGRGPAEPQPHCRRLRLVPPDWKLWSPWDALRIDESVRASFEARGSYLVAQQIAERLPQNDEDRRRLLDTASGWRRG